MTDVTDVLTTCTDIGTDVGLKNYIGNRCLPMLADGDPPLSSPLRSLQLHRLPMLAGALPMSVRCAGKPASLHIGSRFSLQHLLPMSISSLPTSVTDVWRQHRLPMFGVILVRTSVTDVASRLTLPMFGASIACTSVAGSGLNIG